MSLRARKGILKETAYFCGACREADKNGRTHPGMTHMPGICDCICRESGVRNGN